MGSHWGGVLRARNPLEGAITPQKVKISKFYEIFIFNKNVRGSQCEGARWARNPPKGGRTRPKSKNYEI